jgi:hypothetical protein
MATKYIEPNYINEMNAIFKLGFKGHAARKEYELILKRANQEKKLDKKRKEEEQRLLSSYPKLINNIQFRRTQTYQNFSLYT